MEALGVLKFWRSSAAVAEARSDIDDVRSAAFGTEDEETDDEDELFDLVFASPSHDASIHGDSKKEMEFVECARDVLLNKIDFANSKAMSPVTILRSAQKFKAKFVLGFRKSSKCEKAAPASERKVSRLYQLSKSPSDNSSAKYRVAELTVAPVFARDNSLRSKIEKENSDLGTSPRVVTTEKSVPKYLKLIKPFYIKVSKKVKLTEPMTPSPSPATAPMNLLPRKCSEGSRLGGFKFVPRNLRKSRSASAAVGAELPSVLRRDDSLLQQHDGVQSAILHCKKSFNSSSQGAFAEPIPNSSP